VEEVFHTPVCRLIFLPAYNKPKPPPDALKGIVMVSMVMLAAVKSNIANPIQISYYSLTS